jgi:hypothetical protein
LTAMRRLSDAFPLNASNEYDFYKFYEQREKGDLQFLFNEINEKMRFFKI